MTERTDIHRESEMIPTDYRVVLTFGRLKVEEQYQACPGAPIQRYMREITFRVDCESKDDARYGRGHVGDGCCVAKLRQTAKFFEGAADSFCTICGAWFKHGDVWAHKATGEHILVGHTCSAKFQMHSNRSEWQAWQRAQAKLRSEAAKAEKWATARRERRASNPDLFARLEALSNHSSASSFARDFALDLTARIDKWGLPSERQLQLLSKLETEARERAVVDAERAQEVKVAAPEGRVTFTGEIVSVKAYEGDWGTSLKLTVKVKSDAGVYLVWVTAPVALCYREGRWSDVKSMRGQQITLKATLTRSDRDEHFAFGKRPTLIEQKEVA